MYTDFKMPNQFRAMLSKKNVLSLASFRPVVFVLDDAEGMKLDV